MLGRLEVTAEGEDDVPAVGVELSRGREVLAEAQQGVKGVLRNAQRLTQIVAGRLGEGEIDPEEPPRSCSALIRSRSARWSPSTTSVTAREPTTVPRRLRSIPVRRSVYLRPEPPLIKYRLPRWAASAFDP